jgi:hypothetical protein
VEGTAIAASLSATSNPYNQGILRQSELGRALDNVAELVDATALTNGSIALSWAPLAKAAQYRLYSDMGSGYGLYVYKALTTQPAFIDKLLRPHTTYRYRLTQLEAGQELVLAQIEAHTLTSDVAGGGYLASQPERFTADVVAVPTALPPDAVLLGLVTDNDFTDEFNTLTIVGEIRNDTNLNVGQTAIDVTFYDQTGVVIGAAEGAAMLEVIPPGEKSPFIITLSRPSGFASYSLRAIARPVAAKQTAQLSVVEVRRFEDNAGFFHIKGVVKNVGNVIARRVKVAASIYGRDNGVINIGFTYVDPPVLGPGEQAAYDVIFAYYPRYVTQQVIVFEE